MRSSSLLSSGQKLSSVNGVLFTSGSEKQGVYFETIKIIYTDSISYFGAISGSHKSVDCAGPYFLGARE